ncbi:MAG TPA: NAD(P)-dependent oxidoreductase [Methylomirabilota bacterium]|jgi:nucleoside-diphosphate-sugar epimerase|nr:NAD(P)-dependent oxidoreductase [Methylomirabilota bacterium]
MGAAVRRRLEGRYALRALNRRPVAGVECHQADIADLDAIAPAFVGVDAVVHLAANVEPGPSIQAIVRDNVVGTYNVFEAARRAGVRRVIYASSGATVSDWEREEPYAALVAGRYDEVAEWPVLTHESPTRPNGLYGCSKVWGEALARHFADTTPLSMICLRIGRVTAADRPVGSRELSVWCSQRDIAQMVERCLVAPDHVRFDVFFVCSENKWTYRDIEHARAVVGFVPEDRAEDHRPR